MAAPVPDTPRPTIEFWYEFASTYSYPAAMRVERLAGAAGLKVVWRPFLLGPIFQAQGLPDSPFNIYAGKGRYMWRDLERICALEGLTLRRPSVFPRSGLLAARVATAGLGAGWVPAFSRAVYAANFAEDRDITDPAVIGGILDGLGLPVEDLLAQAASAEVKDELRRRTEAAAALGIFGAPNFIRDGELFWGNDRLEQALAWRGGL